MHVLSLDPGPDMAETLARHLERFLAKLPASVLRDRRDLGRLAIPHLLKITPIDPQGCQQGEPATAVGKDLSRGGIGLFHHQPLPHRHVLVTFEDPRLERLSVEVELNRCRFSNLGWYESGGRLLRVADPPPANAALAG